MGRVEGLRMSSPPALMHIVVMHSPAAGAVQRVELQLPNGATVADALLACGAGERWPALPVCGFAIWNRQAGAQDTLRDGDRLDVLRPLTADPNESRRQRYRNMPGRQGGIERSRPAKANGLAEPDKA